MSSVDLFCKFSLVCLQLCVVGFGPAKGVVNQQTVDEINSMDAGWKAGMRSPSVKFPKVLPKSIPRPDCAFERTTRRAHLPLFFNGMEIPKWDRICGDILRRIRQEGECDSSYAVATASMLSDRICLESNGKIQVHLSAHDIMTCCESCRLNRDNPCEGGCALEVLKFWRRRGIVSGGECNSREGCKPFDMHHSNASRARCENSCTNKYYSNSFENDKHYGGVIYRVPQDTMQIKHELYNNGPVVASMVIYEDLELYKSGVYTHLFGKMVGIQYFKIIGWGWTPGYGRSSGNPNQYWLAVNSLGTDWGENGKLKIQSGVNLNGIEEAIMAGRMKNRISHREERISFDDASSLRTSLMICVAGMVLLQLFY